MFEIVLTYLILYGLKNNIVVSNTAGALQFQREKMYKSFRLINTLLLMLGILLCSFINYALHNYVYGLADLEFVSITVMVLFAGLYNIGVSAIWTKISTFKHYLYETSFSYVMDVAYTLAVVCTINLELPILYFSLSILALCVIVFVMNAVIGFYVESINKSYINANFRHVPTRLFLLAIFSILLYYAGLMII